MDLSLIPFVEARWYRTTSGRVIDLICLHDMEFPDVSYGAEWCAGYFHSTDRKASTHFTTDDDSVVRCVLDKDVAYGAAGTNHNGLHIEMTGYANQSFGEWMDPFGRRMMTRTAALVAELCKQYRIPAVYLDADALRAGQSSEYGSARGITTHLQSDLAFPPVDEFGNSTAHHDPGWEFPIEYFMAQVEDFLMDQNTLATWIAQARGGPEVSRTIDRGGITIIQTALRDRSVERRMEADWNALHPEGPPWTLVPQYVWVDWAAGDQFTHLEASGA